MNRKVYKVSYNTLKYIGYYDAKIFYNITEKYYVLFIVSTRCALVVLRSENNRYLKSAENFSPILYKCKILLSP